VVDFPQPDVPTQRNENIEIEDIVKKKKTIFTNECNSLTYKKKRKIGINE
jgi:hypothetical protein